MAELRRLLTNPWIAGFLGLVLGAGLVAPLFAISRLLNARNADVALYVVMGSVFGGLFLGLGLLVGYRFVAPGGFALFGSATIVGFVAALGVLSVRLGLNVLSKEDSEG